VSAKSDTSAATPQPRRRRWKRWAAGGVLLVVLFTWQARRQPPEIEGARLVRLGQTPDEVHAIVKEWVDASYEHGGPELIGLEPTGTPWIDQSGYLLDSRQDEFRALSSTIEKWMGWKFPFPRREHKAFDDWPVHIRFDANLRVDRIKRGSEIIESKQ
jgi:hypothetical protein